MAKNKAPDKVVSIRDIFKDITSTYKRFELADECASLTDKGFISTGSMSLNSIMSGNLHEGIKKGGITAFAGRESVGKTYICMNIMREAQKQDMGVILFDAEGAYTNKSLTQVGVDPETVLFQNADTIHNFQIDVCNILKELNTKYPEKEWLVVLDSLVNLITEKELEDTKKGEIKSDQGQRAKQIKAASRMIQKSISSYNGTLIITNHTYESPGAYPGIPPEEIFSGGSGFLYMAHQIVFLKKYDEKEEILTVEGSKKKKQSTGIRVVAITKKNRCCPSGKSANFYINYKKGLLKK
jgi:recombination protein RecA